MDRAKRSSNQGNRRTAANGTASRTSRTSRTSVTPRTSSNRARREPSESSNARSRSRTQREQQQPSTSQSASTLTPTVPTAAPIVDDGPSRTQQQTSSVVQQRSSMDTYNDVMLLLEHFDELVNMLNNPGQAAVSAECLGAITRIVGDMSGLLRQPSSLSAFTGAPTAAAPVEVDGLNSRDGSDGVQQRLPMATFNDLVALVAHFEEIVNLLSNPEETVMSAECLDVMGRLFDDLSRLLRYVSGCLHRLPTNGDRMVDDDDEDDDDDE